jgi:hypothetical protein
MLTEHERENRRSRLAAFDRAETVKWFGWLAVFALMILIYLWSRGSRLVDRGDEVWIVEQCKPAYARAQNAFDSTTVDRLEPISDPTAPHARITCGDLRRAGKLER